MKKLFLGALFLVCVCIPVNAKEQYPGQYDAYPPEMQQWFKDYYNDQKVLHCCGESDCHLIPNGFWDVVGDHFHMYIPELKEWADIPNDGTVVTNRGNPTQNAVACYKITYDQGIPDGVKFYCFTPGPLT